MGFRSQRGHNEGTIPYRPTNSINQFVMRTQSAAGTLSSMVLLVKEWPIIIASSAIDLDMQVFLHETQFHQSIKNLSLPLIMVP